MSVLSLSFLFFRRPRLWPGEYYYDSRFRFVTVEDAVENPRQGSHGEQGGPGLGTPRLFVRGLLFATIPMDRRAPERTSY